MIRQATKMIGLDTNILARYYIQDNSDQEAQKQHLVARRLIVEVVGWTELSLRPTLPLNQSRRLEAAKLTPTDTD